MKERKIKMSKLDRCLVSSILAIDPGQTGALIVVDFYRAGPGIKPGPRIRTARSMPLVIVNKKKALDITAVLEWLPVISSIDVGVIENVHSMPKQGVASSFQFGRMFGGVESVIYLIDKQGYVSPRTWKTALALSKDKHASMDLATRVYGKVARARWWPMMKHEGIAEAALIAYYWYEWRVRIEKER